MLTDEDTASPPAGRLDAEPAQRILAAARRLVGERGIENSHVGAIAEEAGLARGLVRYYFGSKDGLLAEVMEADSRDRLQLLREHLGAGARRSTSSWPAWPRSSGTSCARTAARICVLQELGSLALRDPAIRARRAQLRAGYRREFAAILRAKHEAGVIALGDTDAESVAGALIALGQGVASEALADPDWDPGPALQQAGVAARHLLSRVALAR